MDAVGIGDVFNETDSDTDRIIVGIRGSREPPTVVVRPMKKEDESEDDRRVPLKCCATHTRNPT